MSDIVAFIRARLDADHEAALAASPGPWHPSPGRDEVLAVDGITVCDGFALSNNQLRATVDHIARHDPARALRHVTSIRDVLRSIEDREHEDWNALWLLAIADSWADHPDFDPSWSTLGSKEGQA